MTPKNLTIAIQIVTTVLKGKFQSSVFDIIEKDGSKSFYESNYNPIRDEDNYVFGVSVLIRDITNRMKIEQVLKASEEKFAKAFKSSPDAIIITTVSNGEIIEFNEGFLTWSGYTEEEIKGKTTMELNFWDAAERELLKLQLKEHGRIVEYEVHLKTKSGEVRICLMSAETIELEGELCFVSITRDITTKIKREELLLDLLTNEKKLNEELAQREEELTSNEEELRQSIESQSSLMEELQLKEISLSALINNTNDFIYSVDKNLCLVEFNSPVVEFYKKNGITLQKGKHINEFISKKNSGAATRVFNNTLQGNYDVAVIEFPGAKGEILFFESCHNPIRNENNEVIGVSVMIRDVTERTKVLKALKASEEKYSKWFQSSPDSILISTAEERKILEVNESFLITYGLKREEVYGKTVAEVGFVDDEPANQKIRELLSKNEAIVNLEVLTRNKKGEKIIILLSIESMEIDGAKCILSIARDITHLKLAEEEKRIASEQLQVVINNIPVAIWTVNKDGIITLSEGKALSDMGLKPGEHVGQSVFEIYKDRPEQIDYVRPVLDKGITHRRSEKIDNHYYDEIITPMTNNKGEITGLIGISFDVTEVREKKNQLRENEALLNNIIDHLPIGLQIFDNKGYSIKMNQTQQRLLGLKSKEKGIGKFNAMTDPVNTVHGLNKLLEKALKGEIVDNIEFVMDFKKLNHPKYNRNDLVWFNLWLYPIFNENGKVVAIINLLADITERKLEQEMMEQKNEELIHVNKMMADYKLMALRSAMNPHFIFNAMNSIQYFISKNERENALIYLSLFSKLIRNILTGTVENKITIHHELETLQNYIELENLRFDTKFDVEFEIDGSIDIRHTDIPSLLLQPYVENAILHGLYNKEGKGKLIIKVASHKENTIIFVVEDNGIGREEARKIKEANQIHNHKSVGMVLTKERLDIINKTNNISVNIIDLTEKDGSAAGTRIEIFVEL